MWAPENIPTTVEPHLDFPTAEKKASKEGGQWLMSHFTPRTAWFSIAVCVCVSEWVAEATFVYWEGL